MGGVRTSVNIHQIGRWEGVRGELSVLIDNVMVTIVYKRVVVSVEELFSRVLQETNENGGLRTRLTLYCTGTEHV